MKSILFSLLLTACGSSSDGGSDTPAPKTEPVTLTTPHKETPQESWERFDRENANATKLRKGMSKAQVLKILGPPDSMVSTGLWQYQSPDICVDPKLAWCYVGFQIIDDSDTPKRANMARDIKMTLIDIEKW